MSAAEDNPSPPRGPKLLEQVDRLVLLELYAPLLFGIGMFAMLTLVSVALQEALKFITKYNLPVGIVVEYLLLDMPRFIMYSIPMGMLLGCLLSAGRLNSDHEITGLRALGVSLYRVCLPYLATGLLLSILTLLLAERVVPLCNSRLKELKNSLLTGAGGQIQTEQVNWPFFVNGKLQWLLIAGSMDGNELRDVTLVHLDPKDRYKNAYVTANRAVWQGKSWTFYDMQIISLEQRKQKDTDQEEHRRAVMEQTKMVIPDFNIAPDQLILRSKTADDLTYRQLSQVVEEKAKAGETGTGLREFMTKLAFKLSIPFTPFFFALIALPLAIRPQRSTSAVGMGIALLIVIAFYVVMSICQKAGTAGALPPVVAAWVPNALMLVSGCGLLWLRERG
jgi:lipopolysaccharide export system permease protein